MKDFWQHDNGKVYVIESDSFGQIMGAAGPVENPCELERYVCKPAIVDWVKQAMAEHKLHRVNPFFQR
jgi:hypothetical protein